MLKCSTNSKVKFIFAQCLISHIKQKDKMVFGSYASPNRAVSRSSHIQLDETEKQSVLSLVNSLTKDELRKLKGVSSSTALEIIQRRTQNGPFTAVEELLEVPRVGMRTFNSLCSILKEGKLPVMDETSKSSKFESASKLITPEVTKDFLATVREVTSLEFGSESVHFTSMTPDFRVKHWSHIDLLNTSFQKQSPFKITEEAYRTVELLPKSDLYLIEMRMIRKLTPSYMQMLLFIKCLQTAVQILLNSDFAVTHKHKVFYMKDSLTIKTFDLRVGSERVSGQNVLHQIEDNDYVENVQIPSNLWRKFYRLNSDISQERYCNSLLIALAFCQHFKNTLGSQRDLYNFEQEDYSDDNFEHEN